MIRMVQCQSAKQIANYFQDNFKSYYVNDQELERPGQLHGRIVKRMGLSPDVTKEVFQNFCENTNPITKKQLTQRSKQNRTVAYDINFHAPKSVSILLLDKKYSDILTTFSESVQDVMRLIEKDMTTTVRKNGAKDDRITGEGLWAEFIHLTARPVRGMLADMHIHSHNTLFNVTYDKVEQCYKAGQFRNIKASMPYYQAMFHKILSDKLISIGYAVRPTKNSFEIVGVPEKVIALFSKRTNEIGQLAKDLNITDKKALDALGAKSRAKKQKGLSLNDLKKHWRKQIKDAGMQDGDGSGDPIRNAPVKAIDPTTAQDCIDHSLDHNFERVSVKQDRRIIETALRFSIGKPNVTIADIQKTFKADKRILKIKDGGKIVCSTKAALALEKTMIHLAVKGKGKLKPLYRVAPKMPLEGDQKEAVTHALKTASRVTIIKGGAGTGKTTLMKELVKHLHIAGKETVIVAPSASASRGTLRDEGFKDADTVAKLLTDKEMQKRLSGQVLIVDEAGLLSNKDMTALLQLATDQKARIIFIGDHKQHCAVSSGDALRLLSTLARIKPAHVTRIYRQKHGVYREAVEALSQGDVLQGFKKLNEMDAIIQSSPELLADTLAKEYVATIKKRKTVLAVSPTHEQGRLVTIAIRDKLKKNGLLGKRDKAFNRLINTNLTEGERNDPRHYSEGLVIRFNTKRDTIKRGSTWTVKGVKGTDITIGNDQGELKSFCLEKKKNDFEVYRQTEIGLAKHDVLTITRNGNDIDNKRLNNGQVLRVKGFDKQGNILVRNDISKAVYKLPKDHGHFNHAYCRTSHASQGMTVDRVLIAQPSSTLAASNLKQFYVSVSRGRDMVKIYTDDKEGLLDHVSQDGDRLSAMELVKKKQDHQSANHYFRIRRQPKETTIPQTIIPNVTTPKVRSYGFKPEI